MFCVSKLLLNECTWKKAISRILRAYSSLLKNNLFSLSPIWWPCFIADLWSAFSADKWLCYTRPLDLCWPGATAKQKSRSGQSSTQPSAAVCSHRQKISHSHIHRRVWQVCSQFCWFMLFASIVEVVLIFWLSICRIHYPLPLPYVGKPDPAVLQKEIRVLRAELSSLTSRGCNKSADLEIQRLRTE